MRPPEKQREYNLKYRAVRRLKNAQYWKRNKARLFLHRQKWRRRNREHVNALNRKWRRSNPEKSRTQHNAGNRRYNIRMGDGYIRKILRDLGFPDEAHSLGLIELKRTHILIIRELRKQNNENTTKH